VAPREPVSPLAPVAPLFWPPPDPLVKPLNLLLVDEFDASFDPRLNELETLKDMVLFPCIHLRCTVMITIGVAVPKVSKTTGRLHQNET
jgi:hypothetical protein